MTLAGTELENDTAAPGARPVVGKQLPGEELPNDPDDNPCWGCGPKNPIGLRMRFYDDGAVVRCELNLSDDYSGSWGRVLDPVLYAALDEMVTWAGWARFGELPSSDTTAPSLLRYHGGVKTHSPFLVEGVVKRDSGDEKLLRAVIKQEGALKAEMEWPMRRRTKEEILQGLARPKLSRSIREELEAMLARR